MENKFLPVPNDARPGDIVMAPAAGYGDKLWPCRITQVLEGNRVSVIYKDGEVEVVDRNKILHYIANGSDLDEMEWHQLEKIRAAAWSTLQKNKHRKESSQFEDAFNEYAVCSEECSRRSKDAKLKRTTSSPPIERILTYQKPPLYALRDRKCLKS